MNKWQKIFSELVAQSSPDDLLAQVGHTVGGQSISPKEFEALSRQILNSLEVVNTDTVLDLCCGNGVFTNKIAERAHRTIGIDICEPLVSIANATFKRQRLSFHVADIREPNALNSNIKTKSVNKINLFAALQHFSRSEFRGILLKLFSECENLEMIYIGFVPDSSKQRFFYNTFRRKATRALKLLTFDDRFGRWWNRKDILTICDALGARCDFSSLPPGQHATEYRFNVLVTKRRD